MKYLKEDGSLNVEHIDKLPLEEYMNAMVVDLLVILDIMLATL